MIFNTKEELIAEAKRDGACEAGLQWAIEQESLEDILEKIHINWRVWCIRIGYEQFSEYCDWMELNGWQWASLLAKQTQLVDLCDWSKLLRSDWSYLLSLQPQLRKYKEEFVK
jgi:hypothetical protein